MDISKVISDAIDNASYQTSDGMIDLKDPNHIFLVKKELKQHLDEEVINSVLYEATKGDWISDELKEALEAKDKTADFNYFIDKTCSTTDIRKSAKVYIKTIKTSKAATEFVASLGRLAKPAHNMKVKGTVEKAMYALNAKGIGTGEIWLGYVVKNSQIQGGGVSFDLLVGGTKYEVKDYGTKGPSTAIRVGVEGNVAQHGFWRQVLDTLLTLEKIFDTMGAEDIMPDQDFIQVSKEMIARKTTISTGEWNKTDLKTFRDFYVIASNLTAVEDTGFNQIKFIGPNRKPITKTIKPIETADDIGQIDFIENDELYTQVDIVNQLKKLPYVRKPSDFQKGLDDAISKIVDKGTAAEWIIFRKGVIKVLKGAKKFKFSHVSQGGVRILDL